jgi:hypothetical protein
MFFRYAHVIRFPELPNQRHEAPLLERNQQEQASQEWLWAIASTGYIFAALKTTLLLNHVLQSHNVGSSAQVDRDPTTRFPGSARVRTTVCYIAHSQYATNLSLPVSIEQIWAHRFSEMHRAHASAKPQGKAYLVWPAVCLKTMISGRTVG